MGSPSGLFGLSRGQAGLVRGSEALAPSVPPQEIATQGYRLLEQVGVGGNRDVDRATGFS